MASVRNEARRAPMRVGVRRGVPVLTGEAVLDAPCPEYVLIIELKMASFGALCKLILLQLNCLSSTHKPVLACKNCYCITVCKKVGDICLKSGNTRPLCPPVDTPSRLGSPNLICKMVHDESWKSAYFGVNRSKVKITSHRNSANVGVCTLVRAGFF